MSITIGKGKLLPFASKELVIRPSIRSSHNATITIGKGTKTPCLSAAVTHFAQKRGLSISDAVHSILSLSDDKQSAYSSSYERMGREMAKSIFCLVPPGDTLTTSRFVTALAAGCIPVIVHQAGYRGGPFGLDGSVVPNTTEEVGSTYSRRVPLESFWVRIDNKAFVADPEVALREVLTMSPAKVFQLQGALRAHRLDVLLQVPGAVIGAGTHILEQAAECKAFKPDEPFRAALKQHGLPDHGVQPMLAVQAVQPVVRPVQQAVPQRVPSVKQMRTSFLSRAAPSPQTQESAHASPKSPNPTAHGSCPPLQEKTTVVITAHACSMSTMAQLNATIASVALYAPGADVLLMDSTSPLPLAPLFGRIQTVRLDNDGGQLSALRALGALGGARLGRVVFLQHSTPFVSCLQPRRAGCVAGLYMVKPLRLLKYYTRDVLTNAVLNAAGTRFPSNFTAALHCAIDFTPAAVPALAHFGLWKSGENSSATSAQPPSAAVRHALYSQYVGRRSLNTALEMWCGAAVALANGWPKLERACLYEGVLNKVHGKSYQKTAPGKEGCNVTDLPAPENDRTTDWLRVEFGDALL